MLVGLIQYGPMTILKTFSRKQDSCCWTCFLICLTGSWLWALWPLAGALSCQLSSGVREHDLLYPSGQRPYTEERKRERRNIYIYSLHIHISIVYIYQNLLSAKTKMFDWGKNVKFQVEGHWIYKQEQETGIYAEVILVMAVPHKTNKHFLLSNVVETGYFPTTYLCQVLIS